MEKLTKSLPLFKERELFCITVPVGHHALAGKTSCEYSAICPFHD